MNLMKKKGDETIDKDDKKHNKSDLIYDANHSLQKYHSTKKSGRLALKSKCLFLANFCDDLDKFSRLKPQKEKHTHKKTTNVYDTASALYNMLLEIYFDEYYDLSDAKGSKMNPQI